MRSSGFPDEAEARERARNLIALDARNVMRRILARQDEMISHFSRHRDRDALLGAVRSWFDTAGFGDLVLLEPVQQSAVSDFYEQLDELRFYFRYTEDMPGTVEVEMRARVIEMAQAFRALVAAIGEPVTVDGRVVVDADEVADQDEDDVEAMTEALLAAAAAEG